MSGANIKFVFEWFDRTFLTFDFRINVELFKFFVLASWTVKSCVKWKNVVKPGST